MEYRLSRLSVVVVGILLAMIILLRYAGMGKTTLCTRAINAIDCRLPMWVFLKIKLYEMP